MMIIRPMMMFVDELVKREIKRLSLREFAVDTWHEM